MDIYTGTGITVILLAGFQLLASLLLDEVVVYFRTVRL